jgi:hypothetical protein
LLCQDEEEVREGDGVNKGRYRGSSKHSHGSSSSRYAEPDEPEETLMQEEEGLLMGAPQVEHRVDKADAPYLDLEEDQEIQAYNLIKSHVFIHTPMYNPDLLQKIGMDTEFTTIWRAVGWENVNPMDEMGSRHLTI